MEIKTANTDYASKDLESICSSNNNDRCFDCLNSPVSYASLNNSILLCSSCAIKHKSYDKSISHLRSLYLDSWSNDQLQYLKTGGNKRLIELLLLYNIDTKTIDNAELYYSNLMQFHRDTIRSEVLNLKCPVIPKGEDALKPCSHIDKDLLESIRPSLAQIIQGKVTDIYRKGKTYTHNAYSYSALSLSNLTNRMKQMASAIPFPYPSIQLTKRK